MQERTYQSANSFPNPMKVSEQAEGQKQSHMKTTESFEGEKSLTLKREGAVAVTAMHSV
jgi:hypothetical protein